MADSKLIKYVGTASSFRWPEYGIDVSKYPPGDAIEEVAPDVADYLVSAYEGGTEFEYYSGTARVATGLSLVDGLDIAPESVDAESASVGVFRAGQSSYLPEYDTLSDAPAEAASIVSITGDGDVPAGVYAHTGAGWTGPFIGGDNSVTASHITAAGAPRQILTEDDAGDVVWQDRAVGERIETPEQESGEFVGEALYDLETDPGAFWSDSTGTSVTDTTTAFTGTSSTHVTVDGTSQSRQYFYFDSPRDLSHHALCAAVRWNVDADTSPSLLVFDTDENRLNYQFTAANYDGTNGWVMGEFSPNEEVDGVTVDLTSVEKVHLIAGNDGSGVDFHIDNVRVVPYDPELGGAVMFTADDSSKTQATVMRDTLNRYGFPSVHFVMSTNVGTDDTNHMNETELDRMAENGCYISCHPQRNSLPGMSESEAETALDEEYAYVASRWGRDHAAYMSWPFGDRDEHVTEYAKQYHKLSFIGISGGVSGWRTAAPMGISRCNFSSLDGLLQSLEFAEKYNRVCIPQFHTFDDTEATGGVNCTPSDFGTFVQAVYDADVDVITPERLYEVHSGTAPTEPPKALDPDGEYSVRLLSTGDIEYVQQDLTASGAPAPTSRGHVASHDGTGTPPAGLYEADPANSQWVGVGLTSGNSIPF